MPYRIPLTLNWCPDPSGQTNNIFDRFTIKASEENPAIANRIIAVRRDRGCQEWLMQHGQGSEALYTWVPSDHIEVF